MLDAGAEHVVTVAKLYESRAANPSTVASLTSKFR